MNHDQLTNESWHDATYSVSWLTCLGTCPPGEVFTLFAWWGTSHQVCLHLVKAAALLLLVLLLL